MTLRERLVRALLGDVIDRQVGAVRAEADAKLADAEARAGMAQTRVREQLSTDDQRMMEQGFRRITSSSQVTNPLRDLQPLRQDHMLRLVYWLWESNPLAKWLIETTVDFVLGEGATVTSDAPDVQTVIDAFWNDPVNQLERRMDPLLREYGMYGELCLPAFVNEVDGHVRLAYVDPFEIDRVVTDPDNVLINTAVKLKARAGGERPRVLKVIREDTARASSYFGLMMPNMPLERDPTLDVTYDGCCFLFQTNKISNGRRGRSDILPLIDWLDGYDQFLFDSMDTASLWNSFAWDVTLDNMNEQQIEAWYQKFAKDIKRNGVFAHNEKVTLKAVTPDLKAPDKDQFARLHRGHILGSMSYPEHWYGLAGHVNMASAKEMGMPPVKRLTRRQKELRFLIGDLVRFQLHQKIRVGVLPRETVIGKVDAVGDSKGVRKPTDQAFQVVLPELSMKDQAGTVAALTSLVAALIQAKGEGWVRPQTAANLFCHMVSQLGMEIDGGEEFTPGAGPMGDALSSYDPAKLQQMLERLKAQLSRQGDGNGDNINLPKDTTPVGGRGPV